MATSVLKTPPTFIKPAAYNCKNAVVDSSVVFNKFSGVSILSNRLPVIRCRIYHPLCNTGSIEVSGRSFKKFLALTANGETAEARTENQEEDLDEYEPEVEVNADGAIGVDASSESDDTVAEEPSSVVITSLNLYKEALANNDESKVVEVESFLKSIEDEKIDLQRKVAALSDELSYEKDRVLRISADFDNFRKRTQKEQLSLVTNAQGEVVESLLPVLDNFERAKAQIKVETEGEEKINNSYQSIYKQFVEIMGSIGVVTVETVGKHFDPMLHEAIMREDSTEYKDGIIIEEYRKGFQLGERLLRPSMVKVSAGPGPAKPETQGQSEVDETSGESSTEATSS